MRAPEGNVIELTEYRLPPRLRPALALLRGFNGAVHVARKTIGKVLIAASG